MALTGQNFSKWKGDDFVIQFVIGDATSLTGYSAEWYLADSDSASVAKMQKFSSNGGITFDGNKVLIGIASAETKTITPTDPLPAGNYYHELHLIDPQGKLTVAATGTVTLVNPFKKRT